MRTIKFLAREIYFNYLHPLSLYLHYVLSRDRYRLSNLPKRNSDKVVIVGTGPSLLEKDIVILKNRGYDIVGVNGIIRFLSKESLSLLDYYVIQDIQVYDKLQDDINKCLSEEKVLYGSSLEYKYCRELTSKNIYPLHMMGHTSIPFKIPYKTKFSLNGKKVVYDGYTVVYSAVQLMYSLGYSRIALLGIDAGYSVNVQDRNIVDIGKVDPSYNTAGERINYAMGIASDFLRDRGVAFYNYTRGGNLKTVIRKSLE